MGFGLHLSGRRGTTSARPGNDTSPNLWLHTLTHTGYAADGVTTLAEPAMTFGGTAMFNRVDWGNDIGVAPFMHYRLTSVLNGIGGQTLVAYSAAECDAVDGADGGGEPVPVFPAVLQTAASAPAGWGWFHKYVVTSVTDQDLTGGSPDEVWSYAYSTANSSDPSLWHHDYSETSLLAQRSWSLWQGYSTVTTTHGAAGGPQTVDTSVYYRGMDGDGQAIGRQLGDGVEQPPGRVDRAGHGGRHVGDLRLGRVVSEPGRGWLDRTAPTLRSTPAPGAATQVFRSSAWDARRTARSWSTRTPASVST